jgi:hypothetical protein
MDKPRKGVRAVPVFNLWKFVAGDFGEELLRTSDVL